MNKTLLQFLLEQSSNIEEFESNIDLWNRLDQLDQDQLQYLQDRFKAWYKDKGLDVNQMPNPFKGEADLPHYLGGHVNRPIPDEPHNAPARREAGDRDTTAAVPEEDPMMDPEHAGSELHRRAAVKRQEDYEHAAHNPPDETIEDEEGNWVPNPEYEKWYYDREAGEGVFRYAQGESVQTFSDFWSTINEAKPPRSLAGGGWPASDEPREQPESPASVGPPKAVGDLTIDEIEQRLKDPSKLTTAEIEELLARRSELKKAASPGLKIGGKDPEEYFDDKGKELADASAEAEASRKKISSTVAGPDEVAEPDEGNEEAEGSEEAGEEGADMADAHEVYEDVVSGRAGPVTFKQPSGPTDFNNEIFKITHRVLLYITRRMASGKPEGDGPRIPYNLGSDEYDTDPGFKTPDDPAYGTGPGEPQGPEDQTWFGTKDMWDSEMSSDRESFDCSSGTKWFLNMRENMDKYPNISDTGKSVYGLCKTFKNYHGVHQGNANWWCKEKGMISKIINKSKKGLNVGHIVWAFNEFIKAGIMIGSRAEPNRAGGDLLNAPEEDDAPQFSSDVAPSDFGDVESPRQDWYSRIKQQGMVAEVLGMLGRSGIPVHQIDMTIKRRETLRDAPSTGGEPSPTDARNKDYPVSEPAAKLRAEPGPKHTQLGLDV